MVKEIGNYLPPVNGDGSFLPDVNGDNFFLFLGSVLMSIEIVGTEKQARICLVTF